MISNIFAAFVDRARRQPDSRFAIFNKHGIDQELTNSWVLDAAGVVADALRTRGASPGDITVIVLEHNPYIYPAFIGCVLSGIVPTILPPLTSKQDPVLFRQGMAVLLDRIRPAAVITSRAAVSAIPGDFQLSIDVSDLPPLGER